ncbi:DUF4870 domain-containing protein [Flavisericum labens]|uniref:DUF4870 domain-containing protein n=1 Tax=Flavisericum labens TaxID=3377112 RepID=UPI00387B1084
MNKIGNKIKTLRKTKGLSQEELAEVAKVNLRTIQRIENNENEPRGKTLHLICEALDLKIEDLADYCKQTDNNFLIYFYLSVLVFLIIPLGNIILPLILWLTKKDKVIDLKRVGANLLNFQIAWTFLSYSVLIIGVLLKIMHLNIGFSITPMSILMIWGIFYVVNIILPILFAIKTKNGKTRNFYPNIIKIIK